MRKFLIKTKKNKKTRANIFAQVFFTAKLMKICSNQSILLLFAHKKKPKGSNAKR
jgi:hypothetical protein